MTPAERVRRYAERRFQASGRTAFPTVREVARALRMRQADFEQIVDDSEGALFLSFYHVEWKEPLGGHFVEVAEP